jgi:hypothetical protein
MSSALVVALAALSGCTVRAFHDDGFSCAPITDACPEGFACVAGRCRTLRTDLSVSVDLGSGLPDSGCQTAQPQLAEDFESGSYGPAWTASLGGGNVVVDGVHAHSGSWALHAHLASLPAIAGSAVAAIFESTTLEAAPAEVHVRVWVYLPPSPPLVRRELIRVQQAGGQFRAISLHIDPNGSFVLTTLAGSTESGSQSAPLGEWACLELGFALGDTAPVGVRVNDAPVPGISTLNESTVGTPPLSQLLIGLGSSNSPIAAPSYDAWFDDIIIDRCPIGCQRQP